MRTLGMGTLGLWSSDMGALDMGALGMGTLGMGTLGAMGSCRPRFALRTRFARRLVGARRLFARLVADASPATTAAAPTALGRLESRGLETRDLDARDGGADQLLDRLDQIAFGGGGKREGVTRLAGTAGAADAMDIVLGRVRRSELE